MSKQFISIPFPDEDVFIRFSENNQSYVLTSDGQVSLMTEEGYIRPIGLYIDPCTSWYYVGEYSYDSKPLGEVPALMPTVLSCIVHSLREKGLLVT